MLIFHQHGMTQKGHSMHSAIQMESHGAREVPQTVKMRAATTPMNPMKRPRTKAMLVKTTLEQTKTPRTKDTMIEKT